MLVKIAVFLKLIFWSGKMQKPKFILISLLSAAFLYSYADCPSILAIHNSKNKIVVNYDKSVWESNVDLEDKKERADFLKAMAIVVEIPDEEYVVSTQNLASIECEYKSSIASGAKSKTDKGFTASFTLKPLGILKSGQYQMEKSSADSPSSWVRNTIKEPGLYRGLVEYNCETNSTLSLVGDCPFKFNGFIK